MHKILKSNTSDSRLEWFNVGEYKSQPNMVADMTTASPDEVGKEMKKLISEYQKFRNYYFKDCVLILVQRKGYNIYDRERWFK